MTGKFTLPFRLFNIVALLISSALIVMSQNPEKVLYSFTGGADGAQPHQALIFDQAGNLYGTTFYGGTYGAGTVYRLSPNGDGTWNQTVLYSFTGGADGGYTDWGRLAFDAAGNLYGVTVFAGQYGQGTLFKLAPNPDGTWTESVLHQFTGGEDGSMPRTTPFLDTAGNLYGTAAYGGAYGCGTVYKMTPGPGNEWTFGVIHQFEKKGNIERGTFRPNPFDEGVFTIVDFCCAGRGVIQQQFYRIGARGCQPFDGPVIQQFRDPAGYGFVVACFFVGKKQPCGSGAFARGRKPKLRIQQNGTGIGSERATDSFLELDEFFSWNIFGIDVQCFREQLAQRATLVDGQGRNHATLVRDRL